MVRNQRYVIPEPATLKMEITCEISERKTAYVCEETKNEFRFLQAKWFQKINND